MASILVVCTGNVCRSPIAEGLLRASFRARFGDGAPVVDSAGTAGWEGSGADPSSVMAAAERGVDISSHRARRLSDGDLGSASLVLAMSTEHRDALAAHAPEILDRTFTLKELVRLLEALPDAPQDADPGRQLASRVVEAAALRRTGFEGNPWDDDVMDPLGMPAGAFRAVAWELQEWCARLADGLFGRAPAPSVAATGDRAAVTPPEDE
jgi:protein-tyrosine phosphatase